MPSKVLLLVTLSEWGGAQHIVYLLAKHLRKEYEITVACAPNGELIKKLRQENIRVIELSALCRNLQPWHDLQALWQLYRLMKRERFDVVHAHSTKAGLLGRIAARLAGVSVILFTAHGWAFTEGRSFWKRSLLAWIERFATRYSTKIICVSEHDYRLALEFKVARPEQLMVIHNGLDSQPYLSPSFYRGEVTSTLLSFLGRKGVEGRAVVTFVGRLAAPKDPLTLLQAIQKVPDCKMLIVGDGPLRRELEGFIQQNGLGERVLLVGASDRIPEILAASDIFVLSSYWEGLPLVIIEAMLAGLPVVATRVGGVPELIEEGVTGLLVPPGNPVELARALRALLDDESLRRRMGEAGKKRALELFTLDRMIEQYQQLYKGVIEGC
jgi:glycosyltransferase involved in cell wall biosynthesis